MHGYYSVQTSQSVGIFFFTYIHKRKISYASLWSYIANLSKSIQVQIGKTADEEGRVKLHDCNPHFMWLFRDVTLKPTDKHGKECHIKDYLLQKVCLMLTKYL